ncbi:MAG: ATP-binding cassette domain-containing protein [Halodesulfurarchaeum sp.]
MRHRLTSLPGDPDQLIDELGLRSISDHSVGEPSGGERQRVAIATTLLCDADLYLFDEP